MIATRAPSRLQRVISRTTLRQKLQIKSYVIALVASLTVAAVFAAYRLISLRSDDLADAMAITRMVAENSTGPLAFQDSAAASAVLASLRAKQSVSAAAIDLPGHPNFAVFGRPLRDSDRLPEGMESHFSHWVLTTSAPIHDDGARSGRLQIVSDLRPELWATLRAVGIALAAALALAIALSHVASNRLRQLILNPIETLHAATQRVSSHVDYSFRAEVLGNDELGELIAAFNRMLDRLQSADAELRSSNETLTGEIAQRRRLEKALVDTSRQAGMAEVATGILHNVGNVLNSVNISAEIMRENLDRSQLRNLNRTAELIKTQGDQFAHYVTEDPRGKLLPNFLISLAAALTAEHTAARQELAQLAKNVEHIKVIVAAQQGFAKVAGVIERVTPQELFDEAERIAQASVIRHGVEMVREYAAPIPINLDRARALQILVNFLTNAIHAVKQNAPGSRRIVIRTAPSELGVAFSVIDNGIGIAAENLGRIFTHGYTTRRDGHGFGLHSGALAARLLGGQVRVESAGIGSGANFTVDLPLDFRPKAAESAAETA